MGRWVQGLLAAALLAACDNPTPPPKPPIKQDPPKVEPLKPGQDPTAKFDPKAPGSIKGRVVDEDGKAVADLAVDLLGAQPPADPSEEEKPIASTKTSAEGRFDFKTDGEATFRLRFERVPSPDNPAFTASPYFNGFPFLVFGGQTLDLGDLLHRRWGATFDVSCLTNPDGHPVPGVTVWLWQPETQWPDPNGSVTKGVTDAKGHLTLSVPTAYAGQTYIALIDDKEWCGIQRVEVKPGWKPTYTEIRAKKGRGSWVLKDRHMADLVAAGKSVDKKPKLYLMPSLAVVENAKYRVPTPDGGNPVRLARYYPFKNPIEPGNDGCFRVDGLEPFGWTALSEWPGFKNYSVNATGCDFNPVAGVDASKQTGQSGLDSAMNTAQIDGTLDPSVEGVPLRAVYALASKTRDARDVRPLRIGIFLCQKNHLAIMRPNIIIELKDSPAPFTLERLQPSEYRLLVAGVIGSLDGACSTVTYEAPAFLTETFTLVAGKSPAKITVTYDVTARQLFEQYWLPEAVFKNQWMGIKRELVKAGIPYER